MERLRIKGLLAIALFATAFGCQDYTFTYLGPEVDGKNAFECKCDCDAIIYNKSETFTICLPGSSAEERAGLCDAACEAIRKRIDWGIHDALGSCPTSCTATYVRDWPAAKCENADPATIDPIYCSDKNMDTCNAIQVPPAGKPSSGCGDVDPPLALARAADGDPPPPWAGPWSVFSANRMPAAIYAISQVAIGINGEEVATRPLVGTMEVKTTPPSASLPAGCQLVGLGFRALTPNFTVNERTIADVHILGGLGEDRFIPMCNGVATIAPGDLSATIWFTSDGELISVVRQNIAPMTYGVNFDNGYVTLFDGFGVSDSNGNVLSMQTTLIAVMPNLPPEALSPPLLEVECSSPYGQLVTLTGTARDRDGVLFQAFWMNPQEDVLARILPSGPEIQTLSVEDTFFLGYAPRYLVAVDGQFKQAVSTTVVHVQDTTPPTLSDFAYNGPVCLWAPDHKYVVLRVDRDFTGVVKDICDLNAHLVITGAERSQPDNSTGDGDTLNDVVVFPDRVCLRSERQGTDPTGRIYSVHVVAEDASGNSSEPTVLIRVSHDQSAHDCPVLAATEFLDFDDPTCQLPAVDLATSDNSPPVAAETGCASASFVANGASELVLAAVLSSLLWLRRRRPARRSS